MAKRRQVNKETVAADAQAQATALPANAKELMPGTHAVLTPGKLYALRDPTMYADDPQDVLTEDIFRSAIPENYYVVQAVGERHYVPYQYDVSRELEPGEQTGFAPNFTEEDDPIGMHPTRERMRKAFFDPEAAQGDRLLNSRANLLREKNQVAGNNLSKDMSTTVQPPAIDPPPPGSLSNPSTLAGGVDPATVVDPAADTVVEDNNL